MSDAAKISEAEKTVLSKVDELGNQYFNELLRAYRQYGGPTGQKVAAMREGLHSRGERNIFQLYGGEITWGEYNKARKELYEEARAETARIATP
jgi:hypothetical protein